MHDAPADPSAVGPQLATVVAVVTCATLPMFMVGAVGVQLRADLDIELGRFGFLSATYYSAGVLFALGGGWLAEALGSATTMRVALGLDAVLLLAIAGVAHSLTTLALLLVVAGMANALAQPSTNLHLAVNLPSGIQGRAFGLKQASVPMASLLGGLAVPSIALTIGWRWAFVAAAVLSALAAPIVKGANVKMARREGRRPECSTATLSLLGLVAGLGSASAVTLGIFMVTGAVEVGIGEAAAGVLMAAASLASISARFVSGWVADRRGDGHFKVVAEMMGIGVAGFALLATGQPVLYVAGAIIGFCFGWGWPAIYVLSIVQLNPSAPGVATSATQAGAFLGSVVGPVVFGAIAGAAGFAPAWIVAGSSMATAAVIMWHLHARLPFLVHPLEEGDHLEPVTQQGAVRCETGEGPS